MCTKDWGSGSPSNQPTHTPLSSQQASWELTRLEEKERDKGREKKKKRKIKRKRERMLQKRRERKRKRRKKKNREIEVEQNSPMFQVILFRAS